MWKIFRNVGADGEEILKTAKLAHAADSRHGFVVTMTDETYSFVCENPSAGVYKISKIPELSGVQVKGAYTLYQQLQILPILDNLRFQVLRANDFTVHKLHT